MESDDNCSIKQFNNKKRGKYNQITLEQRKNFIKRTLCEGLTMKAAAELENINYKSAFVILKCYKKYGRIGKKQTRERKIKSQKKNLFHSKKIALQLNNSVNINTPHSQSTVEPEIKQEFQSNIYQVNFKNINLNGDNNNNNKQNHLTVCKLENDVFANYYKKTDLQTTDDQSMNSTQSSSNIASQSDANNFVQKENQDPINKTSILNFTQAQKQYYDMIQQNMLLMRYQYLFQQQQQQQKVQTSQQYFCNLINNASQQQYIA